MLSAVKPPTNKFIPVQYSAINKLTKWQLDVSLSLTSAAVKFKARLSPRLKSSRFALGCRRQAHAFSLNLNNQPKQQTF